MRARLRTVLGAVALLIGLGLIELVVQRSLERTLHTQLGAVLDATLAASIEDIEAWVHTGLRASQAAADDAEVVAASELCASHHSCDALVHVLAPYLASGGLSNARLVDRRGSVQAKLRSQAADLDAHAASRLARLSGHAPSTIGTALEQPAPALLLAVALREDVLLVAEQPLASLSKQMSATRVGRSGETYAFDSRARMLTRSRFLAAEQGRGRLLELRVPNDRGQPGALTRAVQQAIAGRGGHDLSGYADYRGVQVVGSYRYLPVYELGVVTELDVDDAYRTLTTVKRAFIVLGALLLLALAGALVLLARTARLKTRVEVAEERAQRFGQYRIEEKLGEGGMGAVYLATHALLRRKAAIKLLRADRITPDALGRFEREVQVTSTLTHPNTVAIYDYGRTDGGVFYYVMELLEGLDLHRLVKHTGPLSQARVLSLLRQACGSLAEAHTAGVVHRDIKPANLFVCTRGGVPDTLKVLDFGIVALRALDQADDQIVLGTPEYMAPELFESGTQASPQSDLYSLGIVAYYLLTGAPAFGGGATLEMSHAHLTEQPPKLAELLSQPIDSVLEAAILACLRKQPSARPSSASALITMLNRSPLAQQWTQTEATQWWTEHASVLRYARISTEPEASKRSIMVSTR